MAFPESFGEKLYAEVKNFLENHVQSLYEVDIKQYLILTNFRTYLILQISGSWISQVLIFAIARKIREKAYYKFHEFFLFS